MFLQLLRALFVVGALVLASPASAADPVAPSAADLGALPFLTGPRISPDGKTVAAQGLVNGVGKILIVDISGPQLKIDQIPTPENHEVEWIRWAGSSRILVSLSKVDKLFGEDVRITRLIGIDLAGKQAKLLGPKDEGIIGDDVIHVDPEGSFLLLSTQATIYDYPSVYRIDLATGKHRQVVPARPNVWQWFADRNGVVRAAIGSNGGKSWLLYRGTEGEPFQRGRRDIFDAEGGIQSFAPATGSDTGYAVAANKSGRFALFRYDFKADSLGELVYENPSVDVDDYDIDAAGQVASVSFIDDRPEIEWFDPALRKFQVALDKALPGAVNRVFSLSRDRTRMVIWSSSTTDPGTFYLYDRTTRHLDVLARPFSNLTGKRLAEMRPVRYKARDGLEIRGYLTLPPGRDPSKLPLIVMPHGGPFARDTLSFDPWVQYLAGKGYAVLQPNFRGSTGFGRAFVERGVGQWGRGMQDDIDDGVKWLVERGTADAKRVCIMGGSFGGYAAMWAAVRNPELYRCAISWAGISDVGSMLRYDRRSFTAPRYFRDWQSRVQGDKGFEIDQVSPIKQVDKLTMPILIGHGSKDDNVPLYQSRRLHDALVKLKRPHDYVVYEGEGHSFTKPANSTDFLERVGVFLDKHNPS